jgi:hypothetical protein
MDGSSFYPSTNPVILSGVEGPAVAFVFFISIKLGRVSGRHLNYG